MVFILFLTICLKFKKVCSFLSVDLLYDKRFQVCIFFIQSINWKFSCFTIVWDCESICIDFLVFEISWVVHLVNTFLLSIHNFKLQRDSSLPKRFRPSRHSLKLCIFQIICVELFLRLHLFWCEKLLKNFQKWNFFNNVNDKFFWFIMLMTSMMLP
jgi:hypothetical protein